MTWQLGIFLATMLALWSTLEWTDLTRAREQLKRVLQQDTEDTE